MSLSFQVYAESYSMSQTEMLFAWRASAITFFARRLQLMIGGNDHRMFGLSWYYMYGCSIHRKEDFQQANQSGAQINFHFEIGF